MEERRAALSKSIFNVIAGGRLMALQVKSAAAERLKEKLESGRTSDGDYIDGLLAVIDGHTNSFFHQ